LSYEVENDAKACFDDVYAAPTPHDYIAMMAKNGYEIGEQARPYCIAAAELLKEHTEDAWPVQMLDVGCSYGMGSAFVKYGCSFDEMVAFFATRVPRDRLAACDAMRAWINVTPNPYDVRCVGLDSSEPAISFAIQAGLLDGGIARDFEDPSTSPTAEERSWLRSCNLLMSTGAIGYVTERTMYHVVRNLSKDHPSEFGPLAVLTILRMFDAQPILNQFERRGFRIEKVPDVMLPQRRFTDEQERTSVVSILRQKHFDTRKWEDQGKQFAELFVAARPENFPLLLDRMMATHHVCLANESEQFTYICR
jgi:hypothetical protein